MGQAGQGGQRPGKIRATMALNMAVCSRFVPGGNVGFVLAEKITIATKILY